MDIEITITGDITAKDQEGATHALAGENLRLDAYNEPLYPVATGAELKASYTTYLTLLAEEKHSKNIDAASVADSAESDVKQLWRDATEVQREAAILALTP